MSSVVHRIGPASCHTGHHLASESLIVHEEQWVRSPINAICILAWCQLGESLEALFILTCLRLHHVVMVSYSLYVLISSPCDLAIAAFSYIL